MDFSCNVVGFLAFSLIWLGIALLARHDYCKERDRALRKRDELNHLLDRANRSLSDTAAERNTLKRELESANQTIADMMGDLSIVRMERQGAIEELEKVKKEREELQAKVCELKTNGIEVLNLRIYKERLLARLKSIINDEVYE